MSVTRENLDRRYHAVWDAYRRVLGSVGPHQQAVQSIVAYRRMVGLWGSFTNAASGDRPTNAIVATLLGHCTGVLEQLATLGTAADSAVRPALAAFQSELRDL